MFFCGFLVNWGNTSIGFGISVFSKSLNKLYTSEFPKLNLVRKCKFVQFKCLYIAQCG